MSKKTLMASISSLLYGSALVLATGPACADADPAAVDRAPELQDVLVTAQRREQKAVDVPISINSLSGDTIEQLSLNDSEDLQFAIPGFKVANESSASQVTLRGVGTGYSGPGLEGSVAIYVDDAYISQQVGAAETFLDMAGVEVLSGPQGALYGRNATGGAVLLRSNDPRLDETSGHVSLGYGNLDWLTSEAVINAPISETAAVRFAGMYQRHDGYVFNEANGDKLHGLDQYKARVKILLQPSDELRVVGKFEFSRRNDGSNLRAQRAPGLLCAPCTNLGVTRPTGFWHTNQSSDADLLANITNPDDVSGTSWVAKTIQGALNVSYSTDLFDVSSVTSYRKVELVGINDQDIAPQTILTSFMAYNGSDYRSFVQEIRLATHTGGMLDFTGGVFYEKDKNRFPLGLGGTLFGGLVPITDNRDRSTSWSVFGEGYLKVADRLTLTAGARYTRDRKRHSFSNNGDAQLIFVEPSGESRARFNSFTPRIALTYETPIGNLYASFNKGFKSGGFNSPAYNTQRPVVPEKIKAYEVGAKFAFADRRVLLNIAAFHYDWSDLQVAFIDSAGGGIFQQSAASADNDGIEASVRVAATDDLTIGLMGLYMKSEFNNFANAAVFIPASFTTPGAAGLVSGVGDLSGYRTPNAPKLSGTADVRYEFRAGNSGWRGALGLLVAYTDDFDFAAGAGGPARLALQDSYTLMNATVTIAPPTDSFEIRGFVNNLTKAKFATNKVTTVDGVYESAGLPRTYGVSVTYHF
ncbi:MAG: TonB-dependent receptor [Dehalococcoidia bacterium]